MRLSLQLKFIFMAILAMITCLAAITSLSAYLMDGCYNKLIIKSNIDIFLSIFSY